MVFINPSLGSFGEASQNGVLGVNRMKNFVVKTFAASFALISASGFAFDNAEAFHKAKREAKEACHKAINAKCKGDDHACRQEARKDAACVELKEVKLEHRQDPQKFKASQAQAHEEYKAKRQEARKQFRGK